MRPLNIAFGILTLVIVAAACFIWSIAAAVELEPLPPAASRPMSYDRVIVGPVDPLIESGLAAEVELVVWTRAVEVAEAEAKAAREAEEAKQRQAAREAATAVVTRRNRESAGNAAPVPAGSVWDRLAQCEAGGDWSINTGNGYYGGLQFHPTSWRAVGGTGLPHHHSREEQIYRGQKLQALQGWGAWPGCARQLGLR